MQRFGQTEAGEGQPFERAVARLYRHVLGRQPDQGGVNNWARTAQQRGLAAVVDGFIDSAEYNNNFGEWGVPGSGGLRYCANGAPAPAPQSSQVAPRFRGLDDNGDGVISRAEWNGNNVSFNNQDWNGDGVISGQELRTEGRRAGRRANDYDFDALDVNNNNRVERREWQARLEEFNRLNTNGDNFLTRDELEGDVGGATVGTAGRARAIAVGGDRQWVDTGIFVNAGDTVTINARGQIRVARDGGLMTAAGIQSGRTDGATIPNAPVGGLVARFGETAAIFIGESRTFRSARGGRLYLGVNDNFFDDNTGQFNVTVDVN
jgi:Ca2+-binding EF-hand superfamily protein